MLILLLGPDDFSKKQYIRGLAEKYQEEAEVFVNADAAPPLLKLLEQDLFAKKKLIVLDSLLPIYKVEAEILDRLAASNNIIIFTEEKIDRRQASSKLFLSHKALETKNFDLPHGQDLDAWIVNHVKDLGGSIGKAAAALLAEKLGRDESIETKFGGRVVDVKEIYNLWQADGEIKKLLAYAAGQEIGVAEIHELVWGGSETDSLQIANAIGGKNKQLAFALVADFLSEGGEDKGRIIQLNAMLSEQFRNILIVQDFTARKLAEAQILEATGWKSGRLFVTKKTAAGFMPRAVLDLLNKLSSLDREIKTGGAPPRVLLELVLSQLFV